MANSIFTFKACLCLMGQGDELVPYDTAHIEAASEADAVRLSKQWARDAAMSDDSYLQVLQGGKAVARLGPAEF